MTPFRPNLLEDSLRADAEFAKAAQQGEMHGVGGLFEKYRPQLHAIAVGMLGYNSDAQDAVQDTFLTALTRMHTLRDPAAVGGWLHAILRNRCLMERRRRRPLVDSAEFRLHDLPDESAIERQIEHRELRAWVWQALAALPAEQRFTVLLRYFGSYPSYEEIATIVGVPVGTVRSRLADAKAKLADQLLKSAAGEETETTRVTAERDAFVRGIFQDLFLHGQREAFLSHFAPDLRLLPNGGPARIGRGYLAAEVDDDLAAGVKLHPTRIFASGELTLMEGTFENPRENPFHCPPGIAVGFFHRGAKIARVQLHLSARPPLAAHN